jgi:hypothetical protein
MRVGNLYVWGAHAGGNFGPDITADADLPAMVASLSEDCVVAAVCSAVSTLVLTADGELVVLASSPPPKTLAHTEFGAVHTLQMSGHAVQVNLCAMGGVCRELCACDV